eukprot:gene9920-biopygen12272
MTGRHTTSQVGRNPAGQLTVQVPVQLARSFRRCTAPAALQRCAMCRGSLPAARQHKLILGLFSLSFGCNFVHGRRDSNHLEWTS